MVPPGTSCKRSGCKHRYGEDGDTGEGPTSCVYATGQGRRSLRPNVSQTYAANNSDVHVPPPRFHPGQPVFHEGSKGWSCCARRVLEFEEFLKIKGCKTGRHRYLEAVRPGGGSQRINKLTDANNASFALVAEAYGVARPNRTRRSAWTAAWIGTRRRRR